MRSILKLGRLGGIDSFKGLICELLHLEGFTPHWVKPLNGSLSKNLARTGSSNVPQRPLRCPFLRIKCLKPMLKIELMSRIIGTFFYS